MSEIKPATLTLSTTTGAIGEIKRLLSSGLYGTTVEEAAEQILVEALRANRRALFKATPVDKRHLINWAPQ